ncbi:protein FAR-RED IMPAIRED RESPONSE 1-like [Hevea brasiliensis]|uniref:protein FAR-RED IMPAIRED RESPONSE 1-like n=1 Tax=Hevea brasiliensis TaxID=3981 RepID=UPI0025E85499|nr:protein FAR-RED IMPAIRED RESPONSE 1-like [Hevea brasiliensis]
MEEESEENEAEEESQVGEASDGNGNQISVIHDKNQQIELAGRDQPLSVGMYYASINVLFDAYLSYAREKSFSVAKKSASKGNDNTQHNHELDPNMSKFMRVHRSIPLAIKRRLEAHNIAEIRPSKSVRLLKVQASGPEKLSCLPRDCRNFIDILKRWKLSNGDADYINRMFLRMQQQNTNFFHLIDTDEDQRLTNVFLVHPRSIIAYEEFCDVVSVDTTYLVNHYKMPFASIVGVNHHSQSILLGSALISHEDAKTFKWVFSTWLIVMCGRAPNAIMTDQCESMKSTIREVMPNATHRFCIWHILCKVPEKLKGVQEYDKAKKEFITLIYDSLSPTMFERNWHEFVVKYNLEGNEWLLKLYNERQFWVPVYVNHIFWPGMLLTQRSEGMHVYFDGYVNSFSTLKQFIEQHEIALRDKVEKEFFADFRSKNTVVNCILDFQWKRQFQEAYTTGIEDVNEDDEEFDEPGFEQHKILERSLMNDWYVKEHVYSILYNEEGSMFICNYRKFESNGILCAHILKVITLKDIRQIHERYMIRRWRKDVYRRHSNMFCDAGYPHMTEEYKKFKEIDKSFNEAADMAKESVSRLERMKACLEDLKLGFQNWDGRLNNANDNVNGDAPDDGDRDLQTQIMIVRNPIVASSRGRPRGSRFRFAFERRHNSGARGRGRTRGRGRVRGQASNNALTQESQYQASNVDVRNLTLNVNDSFFVSSSQAAENWISL